MPRQYFIPGSGALNETGRRQYFIPGMAAVNESGAANASAAFTESLAALDGHAASLVASAATSDATTPVDSFQAVPRYYSAFTPGGYAVNEGVARQFFVPGRGGIQFTGRAKIIPPVTVAASYSTADSASTADALSSTAAFSAPTADFAFASDLPAAQAAYPSTYGEIVPGATPFGSMGSPPAAARSGGASAVFSEITPGDTQFAGDGGATFNPTFTAPYVMARYGAGLVEPVAVADLLGALAAFGDSLSESSTPADGETAMAPVTQALNEEIAAQDDMAGVAAFALTLAEAIVASDRFSGFIDIPTPLARIIRAGQE